MMASPSWIGPVASWIIEVYGLATIILIAASLTLLRLKQPAYRLVVARSTFVALALLGPLVAACQCSRKPAIFEPRPASFCCPADQLAVAPVDRRSVLLVGLFAVGSALTVGWLALGAVASARLVGRSQRPPEPIGTILAKVSGQDGATPRLLVATRLPQPVALGLIRPTIILPGWFAEQEPDVRIEQALAHEWAHLSNGDLRLLALSRALLPLLFAHPLFAWLRNRVRADQETLADLAASGREGRIAYAEALLVWARSGEEKAVEWMMPALGLWDRPSILRRRIALLLDGNFRVEPRCSTRWRMTVGTLTCACLVGLGGVAASGPVVGGARPKPHTHALMLSDGPEDRSNLVLCCPVGCTSR